MQNFYCDHRNFDSVKPSLSRHYPVPKQNPISKENVFVMFEYFQEFIGSGDAKNVKHLIKQQAEWAKSSNDPRAAA
jgi:hypothetical protein